MIQLPLFAPPSQRWHPCPVCGRAIPAWWLPGVPHGRKGGDGGYCTVTGGRSPINGAAPDPAWLRG